MNNDLLRSVAALSNRDLLESLRLIVRKEDQATAEVVAHLAELESRRLFLAQGFPSLFFYCVRILHLSEYAAYSRIQAARVSRRWPIVLEKLAAGEINLSTIGLLCPHLTVENHRELLGEATHKSKRQVEEIVARIRPLAEIPGSIRKLPDLSYRGGSPGSGLSRAGAPTGGFGIAGPETLRPGGVPAAAPPGESMEQASRSMSSDISGPPVTGNEPANTESPSSTRERIDAGAANRNIHYESVDEPVPGTPVPRVDHRDPVTPLAPGRYRIQFTAGAGTIHKLVRARDLLRHQIPDGNPTLVFDRALTVLVNDLERKRFAEVTRPRSKELGGSGRGISGHPSRHIPADIRRAVWTRDGGCCAFRSPDGRRCEQRGWLEFHHRRAFAHGGPATVDNIELRCRAHNQYEAALEFGPKPRVEESGNKK